jgi:agmatine/peptidylarginine deiminase
MKKSYALIICLLTTLGTAIGGFAQSALPVGMAPGEEAQMNFYLNAIQPNGITTPPTIPIRTAAEWEEVQALTITWTSYQSVLKEIVRHAQAEATVYIVCTDSNTVKTYLLNNNVPLVNIRYVIAPYNSIWIRDYGQNTCYLNNVDSLVLVDWIYNRPRPKDDTIPSVIARTLGIPLFETSVAPYNLVHTGGNFMSDGLGTAFSSELVLQENTNHSNAQIDTIMNHFMGINSYIKMDVLPYDGIHHIDMHMKLLDEHTLLVGQYPQNVADGPQIEANLQYVLSNFSAPDGQPYRVTRIPMPPDINGDYPNQGGDYTTYTNAVFINKTVLLPIYYQQYDTTALRIWREALPGYNVVGITCNNIIQASGAIHCITHSVGVSDPLWISHFSLNNTTNTTTPYQVDARIEHKTGIQGATLFWTTDTTQAWQSVTMNLTNTTDNTWTGFIPAQSVSTHIYYYIAATANSGKSQVRPMPAPQGWWKFEVTGLMSVENQSTSNWQPAYPNPSHGLTCIPVSMNETQQGTLTVIDAMGRLVEVVHSGSIPAGVTNYFINTSSWAVGIYSIVLSTDTQRMVQKLAVR